MGQAFEYPEIETLNDTYSLYLDSPTYGSHSIKAEALLGKLFDLGGSSIPGGIFSYRSVDELAVPGESTYLATKAAPNSVYYISSSAMAQAFTDFPSGFNSASLLITLGKSDRFIQFLIKNSTSTETIYYRNYRNSAGSWGVLHSSPSVPSLVAPTMKSGYTLATSQNSAGSGGYYLAGNMCHVEMTFTNSSQMSGNSTDITVATGFPAPAITSMGRGVPLVCNTINNAFSAEISLGGALILYGTASLSASSTIRVSGSYYSSAT